MVLAISFRTNKNHNRERERNKKNSTKTIELYLHFRFISFEMSIKYTLKSAFSIWDAATAKPKRKKKHEKVTNDININESCSH